MACYSIEHLPYYLPSFQYYSILHRDLSVLVPPSFQSSPMYSATSLSNISHVYTGVEVVVGLKVSSVSCLVVLAGYQYI